MKFKKVLSIFLVVLLLMTATSCKKEVISTETHYSDVIHTDEAFFGAVELIVRATVENVEKEYFTNPDGEDHLNAHATVYNLTLSEVYKGTWDKSTIEVKILNGLGMSPELYLYGEDENYILEKKEEPFLLEIGKEYILGLAFRDPEKYNCYSDPRGYGIQFGEEWTFMQNEKGNFENLVEGENHREMDIPTLKAKLAELQQ